MSIREFVSVVRNNLNSVSLDDYISSEHIYWVSISYAKMLIKREADSRKLFKNTSFFTKLPCVEMENTSISECGIDIPCKSMMKSKNKLPNSFLSNFGSLIQVFNNTKDVDFKEISTTRYKNLYNQKYKPRNTKYFWIENGYLYIPDSEIESLIVYGLFSSAEEVLNFNAEEGDCIKVLDQEFPAPDYMLSTILEATTSQILTKKKISPDADSNLNQNDKI